jgi:hypothetical protein
VHLHIYKKKRKARDLFVRYYIIQIEPESLNIKISEQQQDKYKKHNDHYWIKWKIGCNYT